MEKTIGEQFRSYLLKQEDPSYTIREASDEEGRHIFFETQEASASVSMHTINGTEICELRIVSIKTGRTPFYLHFELNDLSHAIDLFHEMTASLKKQSETRVIHVLLCCTSGITTSYFTARMKDAARMMELPYAFEAVSYDHLFQKGTGADVILLAPQISWRLQQVQEAFGDKPVAAIPVSVFAAYDVNGMFRLIEASLPSIHSDTGALQGNDEWHGLNHALCVCVLIESHAVRIAWRLYEQGRLADFGQTRKDLYRLRDLEDMLDFVTARHPDIARVMVVTPGIIDHGRLTFRQPGIYNEEVSCRFSSRYQCEVLFLNDANAMALGYHYRHPSLHDFCFYFQPMAGRSAGVGMIVHDHLMAGTHSIAGEMQFVIKTVLCGSQMENLAKTVSGNLEIASEMLVNVIACVDPEAVVIAAGMISDLSALKQQLSTYIPAQYLPRLIEADGSLNYMFDGGLLYLSAR